MNFYNTIEAILEEQSVHVKIEKFKQFYEEYKKNDIDFLSESEAKYFENPSYSSTCKIVPPQNVPKRSNFTTKEGQIVLLHAIAHIEYSAIDLALDAAYRFRSLERQFYDDWLEVANDEVKHFLMLESLLHELDAKYGDVAVHDALFEASQRTQTLLERMAVVPRYLEANGLDATPLILKKFQKLPQNAMLDKITKALHVILEEEVSHVKKGDYWFAFACKQEGKDKDVYFEIIDKYYPQGFLRPRVVNTDARKEAGFTCKEINFMAQKQVCG